MEKMKDDIDFESMSVGRLFRKFFIPTLLGMVFSIVFIITDGIFVGQGIGSDALAAVNITAPIFMANYSIALMFGIGASVVASIHLSRKKVKVARINITQAVGITTVLVLLETIFICSHLKTVALFLGASERLLPLILEYMHWFVPFLFFSAMLCSGMFYIRLDGSPKYAMSCNIIAAVINMALDFLFIFIFQWGMFGAALATSLGYIVGAVMILAYLFYPKNQLHLIKIKISLKSLKLTIRNIGYMCRLGASSFLGETAVGMMMFVGNAVFIRYLGEDGVASYSIACYLFPIVFMVYNAIAQSVQPILSFNYGVHKYDRVRSAFKISLYTAIACGIMGFLLFAFCAPLIVGMFLDSSNHAFDIAVKGLPLFASGFLFFGINIVSIGYYQSLERDALANIITILRGFIFVLLCFWLMPHFLNVKGIWLAVPTAEFLTFIFILTIYCRRHL